MKKVLKSSRKKGTPKEKTSSILKSKLGKKTFSRHEIARIEPMTEAQKSFLKMLTEKAGEEFYPELSKAEASKKIDQLKNRQ